MAVEDHVARNEASRERLRRVAERLDDQTARRPVEGEWTVGALLAHIAYWDRFVLARWKEADRDGLDAPAGLDSGMQDLINAAGVTDWLALRAAKAARLAMQAADEVDRYIAALDASRVESVVAHGPTRLLDRSAHRTDHLGAIESLVR